MTTPDPSAPTTRHRGGGDVIAAVGSQPGLGGTDEDGAALGAHHDLVVIRLSQGLQIGAREDHVARAANQIPMGMNGGRKIARDAPRTNPNGIESSSPGLRGTSYPGNPPTNTPQP